jgi:two-component system response regulator LytT
MNILIIEDELLSAEDLADTLRQIDPGISVVDTLQSVKEAIHYFQSPPRDIDLIFSDIQLGDGLSFEIFREARPLQPVIFCTAFDAYAIEAFRNNGLDYILKPFDNATVAGAIQKYRNWKSYFSPMQTDYVALIDRLGAQKPGVQKLDAQKTDTQKQEYTAILVYEKDRIVPVSMQDIALFYIDLEVTRLISFDKKRHIVSQTLDQLEKMCGRTFFRANRQYLLNRKAVTGALQYSPRKYSVDLAIEFPETIVIGKTRTSSFLDWLTQQ